MSLKEYKAKRDFRRTLEPAGKGGTSGAAKRPLFVVQKHAAMRLHYDFRLEMEGVLKSWAVPKGFPTKRGDRRLAVQVEDHPIDYARFEGTIPEGNYGAGTVMVWDYGFYELQGDDPAGELERGKLHLTLHGKKLKGEWTLVRMRSGAPDGKAQWLLLKSGRDLPPVSAGSEDRSALTRRSMKRIAADNDAQWRSGRERRAATPTKHPGGRRGRVLGEASGWSVQLPRLPGRKAEFIEPMKALLVEDLPKGSDWLYELKFDGVRALAIKRGSGVELISRNAKNFSAKYPEVAEALRLLPCREAVLDGEIVALDSQGRSSFELLQAHQTPGSGRPPIFYYVFDVIQVDGLSLTGLPLLKRKELARALVGGLPGEIRFSAGIDARSERVLAEMKARGLEGLIAKRKDSQYESGRRSGAWVKFKWTFEQEFVIGGYTQPRGARSYFGAILVGYHEGKKLLFASKVGTGFDDETLKGLHGRFRKRIRSRCPFTNLPEKTAAGGRGLSAREMRRCTWLEPRMVCQVRFAEWTRDGHLRQPAFLGLREEKQPEEVVREKPG